jgi:hypothetical protein
MGYREQAARHRDPRFARAFAIIDRKSQRKAPAVALPLPAASPPIESTREADGDIAGLRAEYTKVVGKKPYWGWSAMELKDKIHTARVA